jgi:hypothetical protein
MEWVERKELAEKIVSGIHGSTSLHIIKHSSIARIVRIKFALASNFEST